MVTIDDFTKELKLDMIPDGVYREVAEKIGIDNFIKLSALVGGTTIYIPKPESLLRPVRDICIKKEFNGYNYSELAKQYNLSESRVREICGEGRIKDQISIFDIANGD